VVRCNLRPDPDIGIAAADATLENAAIVIMGNVDHGHLPRLERAVLVQKRQLAQVVVLRDAFAIAVAKPRFVRPWYLPLWLCRITGGWLMASYPGDRQPAPFTADSLRLLQVPGDQRSNQLMTERDIVLCLAQGDVRLQVEGGEGL